MVLKEYQKKAAQETLSGIKVAVVARKYEVTPKTINKWVRSYQELFSEESLPPLEESMLGFDEKRS
ncbi:hypothetical protein ACFO9Q_04100 [Paenibacillus sp. GCM10023252]|uniref:hypothetical protein n=1 Tax=Paenibacillus sp. GCM10023252 TaxID=3252649 RepID=UPI00360DB5E5